MNSVPDESIPLGDLPLIEYPTPDGITEIGRKLIPFPFAPPDVRSKLIELRINGNG